jgi:hypothetical protein
MAKFRYNLSGQWYKGNTHIHSTKSDGGWTFAELAHAYAAAGYDFLYRTDHWVASDVSADTQDYPLLWLDGIELDGMDSAGGQYHVVCLGKVQGMSRVAGFEAAMDSAWAQGGMLILAHPFWCGNTESDALRWSFHGVEIYNHVCQWLNGKGDSLPHWNAMLKHSTGVLGFAVDDAHTRTEHPGWNGGWIMVNAPEFSAAAVHAAIRAGDFYSSCGPAFHSIELRDGAVTVHTSPVQFARLVGPAWGGLRMGSFDGKLITEASFPLSPDWPYVYLEIEDARGRRAWTNALWLPQV